MLLGVTGSGKTFTMANVIAQVNRPTLVMAPNKTLAAQLYNEFKSLFPENAVRYFVSYYDYYQPEAYVPSTDTFIEKDASINDEIDKLRHSATKALLERNDVLIVASVSCIYGLGEPEVYFEMLAVPRRGADHRSRPRAAQAGRLRSISATTTISIAGRSACAATRSRFSRPTKSSARCASNSSATRSRRCTKSIALRGKVIRKLQSVAIYPASHYVTTSDRMEVAVRNIRTELKERLEFFRTENRLLEAQRLEQRTMYDLELLAEMGFCPGIENYSRHLTGRLPGQAPPTLLDYFPNNFAVLHRREPRDGAADRRDVSRRPIAQVDAGRFRLPAAVGARQPPA